ncbi:hypothetical protein BN440_2518 [Erwinia amylovora MR1]|nr:hypothetical protein BN440_2518 [Erwinia amylovora MR1]
MPTGQINDLPFFCLAAGMSAGPCATNFSGPVN